MQLRSSHLGFCVLLMGLLSASAQLQNPDDRLMAPIVCTGMPTPREEPPSGPAVSISEVTFSGFIQIPVSEQNEIVSSITRQKYTGGSG